MGHPEGGDEGSRRVLGHSERDEGGWRILRRSKGKDKGRKEGLGYPEGRDERG